MFKVIGGAVICGLALYGLVKYLERPSVKVVLSAEGSRTPKSDADGGVDEAGPAPARNRVAEDASDAKLAPAAT